jgi:hypothetical protein
MRSGFAGRPFLSKAGRASTTDGARTCVVRMTHPGILDEAVLWESNMRFNLD